MASSDTPRRLPRHPKVWWSRIKVKWPILVWAAAAWGAWTLHQARPPANDLIGIVSISEERAAPLETARLLEVPVAVGQWVEAGEVLARFDSTSLDADLIAERLRVDRQFTQLVQNADNALREARLEQARDEAELAALNSEWERLAGLREQNLTDDLELARVRIPREALAKAVEMYPAFIENLQSQYDEAMRMREDAGAWLDDESAGNSDHPGKDLLASRRAAYTLRAQSPGVVTAVNFITGDVVREGEPVVTLLREMEPMVSAFMMEDKTFDVEVGQTVYLYDLQLNIGCEGTIAAISPHVGPLPVQSPRVPSQILRGRQVTIIPTTTLPFLPGSTVRIGLSSPLRSPVAAVKDWFDGRS